jgi:hypothetical protein
LVNLNKAHPVPTPSENAGNYQSALTLYLDEILERYPDPKQTLDTYGGVSNFTREYIKKLRDRVGKEVLISVVISNDVFGCRCYASECILLQIAKQLFETEQETSSYPEWINNNLHRVKDLVSFVSNDEIDLVYFRGEDGQYVLHKGQEVKTPPFSKSGDQPVSRLAALTSAFEHEIYKPNPSTAILRKQPNLDKQIASNLDQQVYAANDVSDEHPEELKVNLHRSISDSNDAKRLAKTTRTFNVLKAIRDKYRRN